MPYQITSGPPRARLTKEFRDLRGAAKRYRELVAMNASEIEVTRDEQPIDPRVLADPAGERMLRAKVRD